MDAPRPAAVPVPSPPHDTLADHRLKGVATQGAVKSKAPWIPPDRAPRSQVDSILGLILVADGSDGFMVDTTVVGEENGV